MLTFPDAAPSHKDCSIQVLSRNIGAASTAVVIVQVQGLYHYRYQGYQGVKLAAQESTISDSERVFSPRGVEVVKTHLFPKKNGATHG
jgi:hypothetical protein